jgi:hypothetical protein
MTTPKMSNSPTLQAIYSDIWAYLEELGAPELLHYMGAFPLEPDYNLVNYGEMRIYYDEIREMYIKAGARRCAETYKRSRGDSRRGDYKISDSELWKKYRRDVGHVAREMRRRVERKETRS